MNYRSIGSKITRQSELKIKVCVNRVGHLAQLPPLKVHIWFEEFLNNFQNSSLLIVLISMETKAAMAGNYNTLTTMPNKRELTLLRRIPMSQKIRTVKKRMDLIELQRMGRPSRVLVFIMLYWKDQFLLLWMQLIGHFTNQEFLMNVEMTSTMEY